MIDQEIQLYSWEEEGFSLCTLPKSLPTGGQAAEGVQQLSN